MLTGEFEVTLDDKGRISLPAAFRKLINSEILYLTRGEDGCLWLYPPDEYEKIIDSLQAVTDPFSKVDRRALRQYGSAQCVEVDKVGRIPITQRLREFAGLSKDCVVLGQISKIEIWDENRFKDYDNNKEESELASEDISRRIKRKRGIE